MNVGAVGAAVPRLPGQAPAVKRDVDIVRDESVVGDCVPAAASKQHLKGKFLFFFKSNKPGKRKENKEIA